MNQHAELDIGNHSRFEDLANWAAEFVRHRLSFRGRASDSRLETTAWRWTMSGPKERVPRVKGGAKEVDEQWSRKTYSKGKGKSTGHPSTGEGKRISKAKDPRVRYPSKGTATLAGDGGAELPSACLVEAKCSGRKRAPRPTIRRYPRSRLGGSRRGRGDWNILPHVRMILSPHGSGTARSSHTWSRMRKRHPSGLRRKPMRARTRRRIPFQHRRVWRHWSVRARKKVKDRGLHVSWRPGRKCAA